MVSKNICVILLLLSKASLISSTENDNNQRILEPNTSLFNPSPTISTAQAFSTLLYNTGNNIIGPVVEHSLSLITTGLEYLVSGIKGEKNRNRRSHAYAATTLGLIGWGLYRTIRGQTIIPGWNRLKNWWNGPNDQNQENRNNVQNIVINPTK